MSMLDQLKCRRLIIHKGDPQNLRQEDKSFNNRQVIKTFQGNEQHCRNDNG